MIKNKKIFILLPDGVGLRNFAYSDFNQIMKNQSFDIVYWNNTPFDLESLGYNEIKIRGAKTHPFTDLLKNARKAIELNINVKIFNDNIYNSYKFPQSFKTIKSSIKNICTNLLINFYGNKNGLSKIRRWIKNGERKTDYYNACLETLKTENPDLVFCTNQRPVLAIAPILAAQDLGIPTATFIFSWDNLPKATMVIETDFYFVWSNLMKSKLLTYYPYVNQNKVFVTGTPQFENHFKSDGLLSKSDFYQQFNLDLTKQYICFSGDDETTSPDDPSYLDDCANAIIDLNKNGYQLGIIFRKCPVDFSGRYDKIVQKHKNLIVQIDPKWQAQGLEWNTVLPTLADTYLLSNTIKHSLFVINLGSSMVFDYASFDKPCCYLNYNQKNQNNKNWNIYSCYKYLHFRSMPNPDSVVWLNNPDEIASKIKQLIKVSKTTTDNAQKWFEIINQHPANEASSRICNAIKTILK